ncbi:flagellar basal body P-ring formation chaperone FlgA [Methylobacterium sp. AMS5]|uniref:flagellar basal body P-ring formation chaperone FlgA n=1 Tax=Methylobacterium sp. AMS5 TaxID=925818 RepID=UPI00074F8968|nr:flagellar basal body P-ring formation chaperone FlgA [Methylobacterium sp. AMS5]AMB46190.1 flagellar basal body P-ring formation protein FlgA [Methylobacterium sp. AMS5]
MHALRPIRRPVPLAVTPLSRGMIGRTVLALAGFLAVTLFALPLMAAGTTLRLRGDVTARGDTLSFGDLVEGAPADLAARALFRAPALGAVGTIQARRIIEAAASLGLTGIETGGRLQVTVQRAARRVGAMEIEAALKRALETGYGLDPKSLSVRLDGDAPMLLAPLDLDGQAAAVDVTYDPRTRRVAGLVVLGERQASLRVAGVAVETREVAVLTRSLNRGEAVASADLTVERRPRDGVPNDVQGAPTLVVGQVAQRPLSAGAVLRSGDVAPPDLVARGDSVAIVFETAGVSLSLRGIANESGRLGASVSVMNAASKKVLQAVVIAPGRVSVGPVPQPQPILQASAAP